MTSFPAKLVYIKTSRVTFPAWAQSALTTFQPCDLLRGHAVRSSVPLRPHPTLREDPMPWRPREGCLTPGCAGKTTDGRRCSRCRNVSVTPPPADNPSGVYTTRWWRNRRLEFLGGHPLCALCQGPATVADHHPISRRIMIAANIPDPDGDDKLRALCKPCHDKSTAARQPGGWNRDNQR